MRKTFLQILDQTETPFSYELRFPDGERYQGGRGDLAFIATFTNDEVISDMIARGSLGVGEAYMRGDFEVEGDVQEVIHLGMRVLRSGYRPGTAAKLRLLWDLFIRRNTLAGSRRNIAHHYDLGNDFYSLWLDEEMQYTCAYFESPDDSLEQAQLQKMDLVCRKLRLQPGETLVEAGCGWGGLALHAAKHYGVQVRSFNISREQIAYAREKARRLNLDDRVEFILDDYRTIEDDGRTYDKFMSVGMLEHVGPENYARFFNLIHKKLKPEGLGLVHTISRAFRLKPDPWIRKYIFPGGYIPSLSEVTEAVEVPFRNMHIVDVDNLRYHYALTLDHWTERFENNLDWIRNRYGEEFVRMWRMYLRISAASFRYAGGTLIQILLCNGLDNESPLTRRHFFAERGSAVRA